MDTLNPRRDTSDPRSLVSFFSLRKLKKVLSNRRGEVGSEETFTLEQVNEKVATATAEAGKGWYNGLSAENRENPTIQKYKDGSADEMAKSHIHLQSLINEKGVIVPKVGADEATIKNFHSAIGVPEAPVGYVTPKIEGLHANAKSEDASLQLFQQTAHKIGLTPEQYNAVYNMYMHDVSAKLNAYDTQTLKEKQTAETNLRAEWAGNYDKNISIAQSLVKKYGGDQAISILAEGQGNHPVLIKMLAKIGMDLSEDALGSLGHSSLGLTPAQAKAKISEIRNDPKSAFMNQSDPGHDEAVRYMESLYKVVSPT